MKKVVLSIIVIVVFWGMGVRLVKAACQGTCTTCDSITHHYQCTDGATCTGPGGYCFDGSTCEYKYDYCAGEATCGCDSVVSECGCTGGCQPGQLTWSNTCCVPNWPDCATACGTAGYYRQDGCGNSGWCPPTEACCTESDPDAPTLVSPVNGTIVNAGSAINLDWNAISNWGEGCPNTNKYSVCISSDQVNCDYKWADTATSVTNYSWTPSSGDSYVTWLIQSNNGSRTKDSETRNFCVEGEFCGGLQCGQLRNCGGNCTGEDSGAPGAPTIVSPLGSALNPVILLDTTPLLDWEGNDPLADSYEINVINPSGGVVWTGTTTAGTTSISVGTALSNNITYRWYVRALNSTCSPYGQNFYSLPSGYGYFKINSPPVIGNFYIFNVGNTEVVAESGSRNHICQSDFNGSRFVNFRLNVSDADGVNDISQVSLNWNGATYILNRGATWPTGATYTTTIDYGTYHDQGIYEIRARAVDFSGTTIDQGTGRNWKVWNCQVPVSGNLYDGSADHSCAGGFNTLADLNMDFRALIFHNITESVTASVTVPNSFVVDMGNLIWNRSYLPLINRGDNFNPNGGLAATGRLTRMTDLGTGVLTCPVSDQFALNVSPYSANPSAKIDFSFIRDQESWYQVRGGGVRAGNSIESGVPVTANALERYLTLGRNLMTTIDNGVVSYANNFSNTNGYNDEAYGSPHSWWKNSSLLPATRYGYQYFYNNLWLFSFVPDGTYSAHRRSPG